MPSSNLQIATNTSPYFDDHGATPNPETLKYARILFRPSRAIQARELNQMQSTAQEFTKRFGDSIYQEGSIITEGAFTVNVGATYLKLDSSANAAAFANATVVGNTSGASMNVFAYANATANGEPATLVGITTDTFTDGEEIDHNTTSDWANLAAASAQGDSSFCSVTEGQFWIRGLPLLANSQTIILEKYANTPSYKIGLTVNESFIDSDEDSYLLDNASNSYNYAAPGADRYKIDLVLDKKDLGTGNLEPDFYFFGNVAGGAVDTIVSTPTIQNFFRPSSNTFDMNFQNNILQHKILAKAALDANTGSNGELIIESADRANVRSMDGSTLGGFRIGDGANAGFLEGQNQAWIIDYNNHTNTPTALSDFTNDLAATSDINQGWHSVWIPVSPKSGDATDKTSVAHQISFTQLHGSSTNTDDFAYGMSTHRFNATADSFADPNHLSFLYPVSYKMSASVTTIKAQLVYFSHSSGTDANVYLGTYAVGVTNGDTISSVIGNPASARASMESAANWVTDTTLGAGVLHVSPVMTPTVQNTFAQGDVLFISVTRDAANASDTYTNPIYVVGIRLFLNYDEGNEDSYV